MFIVLAELLEATQVFTNIKRLVGFSTLRTTSLQTLVMFHYTSLVRDGDTPNIQFYEESRFERAQSQQHCHLEQ